MEPEAETAAPRDLLRQFSGINDPPSAPEEISGEVELSLGLSLGGRIFRSSSISCLPMVSFDREEMSVSPLARTSSLPTETEEARRKRKEMQSVKRMEAKRKRSEKRIEVGVGGYTRRPVGSQDGSCSGASDLQTRQIQASDVPGAGTSQQPMVGLVGHSSITGREIMEEMPSVSTMGEGPNGRRIEGFLYRYRKGEEVRIVCVCHGSFLTPAEFVRHAGGGDVDHPLRHIVVNHKSPGPV